MREVSKVMDHSAGLDHRPYRGPRCRAGPHTVPWTTVQGWTTDRTVDHGAGLDHRPYRGPQIVPWSGVQGWTTDHTAEHGAGLDHRPYRGPWCRAGPQTIPRTMVQGWTSQPGIRSTHPMYWLYTRWFMKHRRYH